MSSRGTGSVELAIRGGTVVTAGGRSVADVGVRDGRIVQLGSVQDAAREIDATGKLLLPGGIDMHVHLTPVELGGETIPWADDFTSGSRAAAAGGVTTVGNITFLRAGEGLRAAIERVSAEAAAETVVDFVLHPVLIDPTPEAIAEIPEIAAGGHTSIKIFMSIGEFDARANGFLEAMSVAGRCGVLTLIHCEDACVINLVTRRLVAAGRGDLSNYGLSRPVYSETVAVARAISFAEAADAPIYIVHLGSADALAEAHRAHARGLPVFVETRPIYLYFTSEKFAGDDSPLYIGNPPLREQRDQDALWSGLACADVHTCCTDHAAWTLEEKLDPSLTIETARPGMSDLETLMPILWSRGVATGRISVERFVEVTSTNAAKLFGLFPTKGTLAVGSDADIVVWDPELTRVVSGVAGESRAGYTLYDGWEVAGWPAYTISRGEIIYADGRVTAAPGRGRLVRRERTRPL